MILLLTSSIWTTLATEIILGIVGTLLTVLGGYLTHLVSTKVKNEKLRNILTSGLKVVEDGVDFVYQTYVSSTKGTSFWDKDAMDKANQMALDYIKNNLSQEAVDYLKNSGKDIEEWAKEQIEIAIKKSKDNAKKDTK